MSDNFDNYDEMEEDYEDGGNFIVLTDEDGKEIEFEFLDEINYNDKNYAVLVPTEDDESENGGEVIIMLIEETEDPEKDTYSIVEDEEIAMAVYNIFKERFASEFLFED
mgnify:CR=1 FL=1